MHRRELQENRRENHWTTFFDQMTSVLDSVRFHGQEVFDWNCEAWPLSGI